MQLDITIPDEADYYSHHSSTTTEAAPSGSMQGKEEKGKINSRHWKIISEVLANNQTTITTKPTRISKKTTRIIKQQIPSCCWSLIKKSAVIIINNNTKTIIWSNSHFLDADLFFLPRAPSNSRGGPWSPSCKWSGLMVRHKTNLV